MKHARIASWAPWAAALVWAAGSCGSSAATTGVAATGSGPAAAPSLEGPAAPAGACSLVAPVRVALERVGDAPGPEGGVVRVSATLECDDALDAALVEGLAPEGGRVLSGAGAVALETGQPLAIELAFLLPPGDARRDLGVRLVVQRDGGRREALGSLRVVQGSPAPEPDRRGVSPVGPVYEVRLDDPLRRNDR